MTDHDQPAQPLAVPKIRPEDPVGGALIDEKGKEVPITETMVREACSKLEKDKLQGL
ncbi:PA1571 family protein [Pseudomonas sp. nanlin1]|uniref:PA1571 family protein n=1 Tax=Pseudomonas sp. nanlin1 TaxID=3040605 RepID=UPI00388DB034